MRESPGYPLLGVIRWRPIHRVETVDLLPLGDVIPLGAIHGFDWNVGFESS